MSLSLALSWEDHEADIAGRFAPFDAPRGFSREERPTRQIRAFYGQKLLTQA
jgi:hypothetical protein